MPISPYVRQLRDYVGPMRLLLPSVSAHVFDARGKLLLVEQRDSKVWSTPGGVLEPNERPADGVVRETWEETGLLITPEYVLGVFGGPDCVVRYPNGDEAQYVITAFGCRVVGGTLRPDGKEIRAAQYWGRSEAEALSLAPWLRSVLQHAYGRSAGSAFHPANWTPPGESAPQKRK